MIHHLSQRFPERREAIETLLQEHNTFKEVCADYEEISAWLAEHCRQEGQRSDECHRARTLRKALELEIIEALSGLRTL